MSQRWIWAREEVLKWLLGKYHWGLIPFWAKDISIGYKMINARSETVSTKPSFREAFKKRRCLIPADGFYEWRKIKEQKQPVYITHPEEIPFAFAGLWETWRANQDAKEEYRSCTIITRASAGAMQKIHHRMPVILHPDAYKRWLDVDNLDSAGMRGILNTMAVTDLVFRPVSKQVNSVRHNDPSNIKPVQMEFDF